MKVLPVKVRKWKHRLGFFELPPSPMPANRFRHPVSTRAIQILLLAGAGVAAAWFAYSAKRRSLSPQRFTVEDRLNQVGQTARARLAPHFQNAAVPYPPEALAFLGLKEEKCLEVYAHHEGNWIPVVQFPILAASGGPGPKLREGDFQVPEGVYHVESLNPNSAFHLSLRLNYPSPEDWAQARKDGRTEPGSDIMIHGSAVSAGCLAMGDPAIEQLFTLAADTGLKNIRVLLVPWDLRRRGAPATQWDWMDERYQHLHTLLQELPPFPGSPNIN
jgi:hypothetical protein